MGFDLAAQHRRNDPQQSVPCTVKRKGGTIKRRALSKKNERMEGWFHFSLKFSSSSCALMDPGLQAWLRWMTIELVWRLGGPVAVSVKGVQGRERIGSGLELLFTWVER